MTSVVCTVCPGLINTPVTCAQALWYWQSLYKHITRGAYKGVSDIPGSAISNWVEEHNVSY